MTPDAPSIAWLDGDLLPLDQARVPVLDRGFLFGDAVYEVIPVYGGRPCRMDAHLQRLAASLAATAIPPPHDDAGWRDLLGRLIEANGGGDLALYLQVTRGVAPRRDHAVAPGLVPTVFAMAMPLPPRDPEIAARGLHAVTVADSRWARCQVKATTLLPNVLHKLEAAGTGADDAILVRDGRVIEATASNVFAVVADGTLVTPPVDLAMLTGVTRNLVIELAAEAGIETEERALPVTELVAACEIWITSSTREVCPVTRLDGRPVGDGRPGPLWRTVDRLYQEYKAALSDPER
ncbi:MAG: D-amino acid aminotransferase [Gammaproteobacteria bacterium]|nr:D-amino acid aminotransferase [Gammaproteobacteria bacterium]